MIDERQLPPTRREQSGHRTSDVNGGAGHYRYWSPRSPESPRQTRA
jgi:hypothetical protein